MTFLFIRLWLHHILFYINVLYISHTSEKEWGCWHLCFMERKPALRVLVYHGVICYRIITCVSVCHSLAYKWSRTSCCSGLQHICSYTSWSQNTSTDSWCPYLNSQELYLNWISVSNSPLFHFFPESYKISPRPSCWQDTLSVIFSVSCVLLFSQSWKLMLQLLF